MGGLDRVYEIGRAFRNEGISTRHNPEFTILEFYMAYATVDHLLDLTERMVKHVDSALRKAFPAFGEGRTFDLDAPWKRITLRNAIAERLRADDLALEPLPRWKEHLGDGAALADERELAHACARLIEGGIESSARAILSKCRSHGERLFALYELIAEPDLTTMYRTPEGRSVPVFITEYPLEVSPLARRNDADPAFVDRFELFVNGREIANAFSELNDPDDQESRFTAQLQNRERGDEEAMDFDADYIRALRHGMPPTAGFGLGVDRFTMTLCGQPSIRDVLLFPLMRHAL